MVLWIEFCIVFMKIHIQKQTLVNVSKLNEKTTKKIIKKNPSQLITQFKYFLAVEFRVIINDNKITKIIKSEMW